MRECVFAQCFLQRICLAISRACCTSFIVSHRAPNEGSMAHVLSLCFSCRFLAECLSSTLGKAFAKQVTSCFAGVLSLMCLLANHAHTIQSPPRKPGKNYAKFACALEESGRRGRAQNHCALHLGALCHASVHVHAQMCDSNCGCDTLSLFDRTKCL